MSGALSERLHALAERVAADGLPKGVASRLARALTAAEQALDGAAAPGEGAEAQPAALDLADLSANAPIAVWCDGSCSPNPGPGGWGAIVEQGGRRAEISGAAAQATNNTMELTAAIEALRRTPPGSSVHVTTDSRYLADGITRWLPGWKRKNWHKADGKPVLNRELWEALDAAVRGRSVRWSWVAGHSGHRENDRCDELANQARLRSTH